MVYINRKGDGYTETVDTADTRQEALDMIFEYMIADPSARYFISRRPRGDSWED